MHRAAHIRRRAPRARPTHVLCLSNRGYPASLERGKVYRVRADADAATEGLLRIVDESGEDYLYPASRFEPVALSARAVRALAS